MEAALLIMTKKEALDDYEKSGMSAQRNLVQVSPADIELIHECWPDNFETVFDIGAKTFEQVFTLRPLLLAKFKLKKLDGEYWKKNKMMERSILNLQQKFCLAMTKFWNDIESPETMESPEEFGDQMRNFGGKLRMLHPDVPIEDHFFLFRIWAEVHIDMTSLIRKAGPVSPDERKRFLYAWNKIFEVISPHFVYGWHKKMYVMSREEEETLEELERNQSKSQTASPQQPIESRRSRLMHKVSRFISRDSFSDKDNDESSNPSSSQDYSNGKNLSVREMIQCGRNKVEEKVDSEPIQINDITLNFSSLSVRNSPIELSHII